MPQRVQQTFPPLESITAPAAGTGQAAFYLGRQKQTLRFWASSGSGPIKPIRINGRLAWKLADIRRVLEVEVAA